MDKPKLRDPYDERYFRGRKYDDDSQDLCISLDTLEKKLIKFLNRKGGFEVDPSKKIRLPTKKEMKLNEKENYHSLNIFNNKKVIEIVTFEDIIDKFSYTKQACYTYGNESIIGGLSFGLVQKTAKEYHDELEEEMLTGRCAPDLSEMSQDDLRRYTSRRAWTISLTDYDSRTREMDKKESIKIVKNEMISEFIKDYMNELRSLAKK